ncbi:MAG: CdaR family protein [Candidatus Polarisedimenticolia bacterium]
MRFNLRQNLYLKIFSLLLALVCWYVVRSEEERVRDFIVPVEYINLPEGLEQSGEIVDEVAVRLRAAEPVLRGMSEDALVARIDLSKVPLGEQHLPVTPGMIRAPAGAEVARIEPELLTVRIEKKMRRDIPVVAEFAGDPPAGYEKGPHTVQPATVTLEGPASEVNRVSRALTGVIHLDGETDDFQVMVTPVPDAPQGSRARIVSPAGPVRVLVSIRPVEPSRRRR